MEKKSFFNAWIAKRAAKVTEKKAKFSKWSSLVFMVIGLLLLADSNNKQDLLWGAACTIIFGWFAFVASRILAFKKATE